MDHGREASIRFFAAHGNALEFLEFAEEVFDEVTSLVEAGNQSVKLNVFDQRFHADGVEAMAGQQDEVHQIAQGIGEVQS